MPFERSTSGPIPASALQDPLIQWCWCVRIDVAAPIGTLRFTDGGPSGNVSANLDGTGVQTWVETPLVVGTLDQGEQGTLSVSSVSFANGDDPPTWSGYVASPGLRNAAVQVYFVMFDKYLSTLTGYFKAYDGHVDNQQIGQWAELVLKPHHSPWSREAPFLTLSQLGLGGLMPDPAIPLYFGDTALISRASGRG